MAAQTNVDPSGFSAAVLQELGIPVTTLAVQALNAMQQGEGQWGATGPWNAASDFNPFNISGGQPVADQYHLGVSAAKTQNPGNGPPVDEFAGWTAGVTATANFLKNADPGMFSALQALGQPGAGQPQVQAFFNAAQNSGSFGASAGSRIQFMGENPGSLTPIAGAPPSGALTPGVPAGQGGQGGGPPVANPPQLLAGAGPSQVQLGMGTEVTLPGNATWTQAEAYIKQHYPTYAWLLNPKYGLQPILEKAAKEGLNATNVQALVAQTPWWRQTSNALRQWQETKATNPADLDFSKVGSAAQQKLGDIQLAAKNAGFALPKGVAENLATEALMYGWDTTQIQENIASVAATGTGQVFNPTYEQGVAQNPREYNIGGKEGTGPAAATAITTVRNAIAGQGYKPSDFTNEDVDNLAKESMEFGWTPEQLAAAVIKIGAGGTGAQLSQTYLQGMMQNPGQYSFGGNGKGPGIQAQQAITAVQQALAAAGKSMHGKGAVSSQQVKDLAQEMMMFGWDAGQLQLNIGKLGKGGGQMSPSYLQGMQTNPQAYLPGGTAYVQAQTAVQQALASQGRTGLGKLGTDALVEEYLQQGWQQDPGKLTLAIGQTKGAGALSSSYLTGMQSNPQQYQPGGVTYRAAEAAVKAALDQYGKTVAPSVQNALAQQYMQQGWTQDSPGLQSAIGTASGGAGYTEQYLTGIQGNPQAYQPGGTAYIAAANDVALAVRQAGVGNLPQDDMDRLIEGVLQQGWDAPTLSNEIGVMAHHGTPFSSGYLTGMAANPLEYQFSQGGQQVTTADQMLTQVEVTAANQQVDLTLPQAQELAMKALKFGWSSAQIQEGIGQLVTATTRPPTVPLTGQGQGMQPMGAGSTMPNPAPVGQAQTNAPGLLQQLRTTAAQYLMAPSAAVLQQWGQNIASGTQDMQQFQAYLAHQAAMKYPSMAQEIAQGLTPSQITDNLQQLAAQTLDISPNQVNFINNPQFQKILDGGYNLGANGTKEANGQMMTYTQAGEYLRGLPQYQYTTGARSSAADLATEIIGAFGRGP